MKRAATCALMAAVAPRGAPRPAVTPVRGMVGKGTGGKERG
jgi:hypothetical protein